MPLLRLQKYLSQAGIASRRKAEGLILKGKITLNGKVVSELGVKVDPDTDRICLQGKKIEREEKKYYYLLYKPRGVIVSKRDPQGRKTVYDLIPHLHPSVNAVGRLDYDSEGLILLTNDGALSHRFMHPSSQIKKLYHVWVNQELEEEVCEEMEKGIVLDEGLTAPAQIRALKGEKNEIWYSIEIHEGKKRQVRKMFAWAGLKVLRLIRVKVGPFDLKDLNKRRYRTLSAEEMMEFRLE
ncbi:MAG: rRNA pseudouridine synthase [Deltaproteobacteria bacterium]|nr:rRNA pseudouridine synthase [Deltaproteobacteria bacterium]